MTCANQLTRKTNNNSSGDVINCKPKLRNVNTVRLESRNIITLNQGKGPLWKYEICHHVCHKRWLPVAFIFKSKKEFSLSERFAVFNWSYAGYLSGIWFSKSRLSFVNLSSRYREVSLNMFMRSYCFLKLISPGWVVMFLDSHHTELIFRS